MVWLRRVRLDPVTLRRGAALLTEVVAMQRFQHTHQVFRNSGGEGTAMAEKVGAYGEKTIVSDGIRERVASGPQKTGEGSGVRDNEAFSDVGKSPIVGAYVSYLSSSAIAPRLAVSFVKTGRSTSSSDRRQSAEAFAPRFLLSSISSSTDRRAQVQGHTRSI
jgi:hypothetical protein